MMKSLIIHKPEDPIDFLIKNLEGTEPKRYVIVGPPGANSKEVSLRMIEQLNSVDEGSVNECINLGDSIENEII